MARIDPALHRLQPVALLQPLGDEGLIGRDGRELPFRQRRLLVGRPHIGPQHRAALHQRVGLELDLLAEAAFARLGGNVDALAGDVVFPAVIGAAQPGLPRCVRTRARRRGGRRTRRSGRTCRRCRGRRAGARRGSAPAPADSRSPAALRPAAPAASSCGTAGPSACRGRSASTDRSVLSCSIGSIHDRCGLAPGRHSAPWQAAPTARDQPSTQQADRPRSRSARSSARSGGRSSGTTVVHRLEQLEADAACRSRSRTPPRSRAAGSRAARRTPPRPGSRRRREA